MNPVKVAVNGYGVIGKRVADAVRMQDDMALVGVADVINDYRIRTAVLLGIPVFAATPDSASSLRNAGTPVAGDLDEMLEQADIVVDCTPKKVASGNKQRYEAAGVKAIFQGGESHALTGHSFVAQSNYASAIGRDCTRVVSCNTTSILRTLGALKNAGLLKRARGTLIRRASDPWEGHQEGIMNTVVPETSIPSHQGPDARTVDPDLDVVTIAVKASHNSSHLHTWWVEMTREATREDVLAAFRAAPRIARIRAGDGIAALNSTIELMADLGRPRGDMWEVALWEDVLTVDGNQLYYCYQVFNQAIVIPETVDAIRALSGIERDAAQSIAKTDRALGMVSDFLDAPQRGGAV
ncbi:MAG: type II glyceraldehyde-3-phosphate dehydrogenase [Pseudomonadota bacterium]|nr:type II glyceraldehyde-3-phosphate dehydrogenase [Nevskiales bacterium]MEC9363533.1 type II glyceraldehyde-3-phosphate dehydrogenase [Pseudomonadota bacterium]